MEREGKGEGKGKRGTDGTEHDACTFASLDPYMPGLKRRLVSAEGEMVKTNSSGFCCCNVLREKYYKMSTVLVNKLSE